MLAWRLRLLSGRSPVIHRNQPPEVEAGPIAGGACGIVRVVDGDPVLTFRARCASEYAIDSVRLSTWLAGADGESSVRALGAVRTLHLATARSRLTQAIWRVLAQVQRPFLISCDASALVPLTARELVRRARAAGAELADPGRVSRTLRATTIVLPDGSTCPLRALCPTTRSVLAARVRGVLEIERRLLAAGKLRVAWDDAALARRVRRDDGVVVSGRIVCYCRRRLGVPGARARTQRGAYISATAGFSALFPLDRRTVLRRAPRTPGVYELRVAPGHEGYEASSAGVMYVGKAQDLRVRLLAHAGAGVRNEGLRRLVRNSRVLFRFRAEAAKEELKPVEVGLYLRFCDTFGRPPTCNRVSP